MKLNELIERLELAQECALDACNPRCAAAIFEANDLLRKLSTTVDGEAIIDRQTYFLSGGEPFMPRLDVYPCQLWASEEEARKQ
jgi:hypothetical protein